MEISRFSYLSTIFQLGKDDYSSVSLSEHLGGCISNNIRTSANWLSEEMIRCIASIYSHIADPPLIHHHDFLSSPISFPSPPSGSSPRDQFSMWSPHCEESVELSGNYFTTLEVQGICKNTHRPSSVEQKQHTFRQVYKKVLVITNYSIYIVGVFVLFKKDENALTPNSVFTGLLFLS